MDKTSYNNDIALKRAFSRILSVKTLKNYISDIAEIIYKGDLNSNNINTILNEYKIINIRSINDELLDLILFYVNIILNDSVLTENERNNISILKKYFKIKEGDFIKKRYSEVEEILQRQFNKLYKDDTIDTTESLHTVYLQEIFDLSYDQLDKFKEQEVINALDRGADIGNLDTARFPLSSNLQNEVLSRHISQEVKDQVWNRDKGRCIACNDNQRLEFDHIIPFSKGGSNTYRNVQLLCEECNRSKSDKIG